MIYNTTVNCSHLPEHLTQKSSQLVGRGLPHIMITIVLFVQHRGVEFPGGKENRRTVKVKCDCISLTLRHEVRLQLRNLPMEASALYDNIVSVQVTDTSCCRKKNTRKEHRTPLERAFNNRTYCSPMHTSLLWWNYKKSTITKLQIPYHNIF